MDGQRRRAPVERVDAAIGTWFGSRVGNFLPGKWTAMHTPAEHVPPTPGAFARFGEGSWVVPPTRVPRPERVRIGDRVVVMEDSALVAGPDGEIEIGDGALLARFVTIEATLSISIGPGVLTSDGISIVDAWGPGAPLPPAAVVIEAGAYLGAGSIIGPGVRVGEGAFVGEGAVVFDDVPAHSVVYGNPAVVTRRHVGQEWIGPVLP